MIELPILNDEEIKELGWGWMLNYDYELKDILQAQQKEMLRWFVEWGNENCPHSAIIIEPRMYCELCWLELKQLAELEGKK